jgi:TPR repeat protein
MPNRLWTQLSSSFPALLLACLMMGTFATTHAVRAAEIAYERPDSSASKQLQRLRDDAQDGSALAQYVLGAMYQLGEIVAQDDAEAAKWISRAADQGLPLAQFVLGGMYMLGQGVPEDAMRAYVWLSLSATQAAQISGAPRLTRDAQEMRDALARTMTPAQIDEAQKLAREWKPNPVRDW